MLLIIARPCLICRTMPIALIEVKPLRIIHVHVHTLINPKGAKPIRIIYVHTLASRLQVSYLIQLHEVIGHSKKLYAFFLKLYMHHTCSFLN